MLESETGFRLSQRTATAKLLAICRLLRGVHMSGADEIAKKATAIVTRESKSHNLQLAVA